MLYFKRFSILMHDVYNDSAPPIASMARSLFQVKIVITTPDPLQLLIFIGNTLDWIITETLAGVGAKIWKSIPAEFEEYPKACFYQTNTQAITTWSSKTG